MSGAGRKSAVVFGLLVGMMAISGVAGAEPERGDGSGAQARATTGEGGPEAVSVTGSQYAEAGGGKERKIDRGRDGSGGAEGDDGGAGNGDGDKPSSAGREPASPPPDAEKPLVKREDTRRATAQQSSRTQSVSQQDTRRVSVSREAESDSEAQAVTDTRRVQSPEIRRRVRELRQEARAGELRPAASSYNKERRKRELRIARDRIVAEPVDEASLRRYKKLYEEAAEEYGFGEDWYVLAAVGKVESDHGQNMGPSSAGALGPMQFMPSTWDSYGLDANDDGKANIMDPEDAIPSAARYLKVGGAPDDWYRALYTYNHAGWYVEKVLRVAEGYRLAADDEEVGPYYPDEDR